MRQRGAVVGRDRCRVRACDIDGTIVELKELYVRERVCALESGDQDVGSRVVHGVVGKGADVESRVVTGTAVQAVVAGAADENVVAVSA